MHLPQQYQDKWSLDHDRQTIEKGDMLYYACDGTVNTVLSVTNEHIVLVDTNGYEWITDRDTAIDGLHTDLFPLK